MTPEDLEPAERKLDRAWVLSQYFRPEPGFITADVAALLARTRQTTVITALPNYPRGRIYDGFPKWRPQRSVEHGCTIWRLPMLPDHSASISRRIVSYASFLAAASAWLPVALVRHGPPDLVWIYQTPFTSAIPAIWLKLIFGTRLIYTVADLWPESLIAAGMTKRSAATDALFRLRRVINRFADAIICSTKGTLEQMAADGVPRSKLHYVPVWVEGAALGVPTPARERRIVYVGNLGPAQQLETVIDGAALLRDRGVDITFDFFGDGGSRAELEQFARYKGCNNVRFHGRVSPEDAYRHSASALGQIVCLRLDPLFSMTIPSKLPFSFSAGTPVLFGLEGEPAALAKESGGGIEFSAGDPVSFADAVQKLLALSEADIQTMSQRLRSYYSKHFARDTLIEQYASILNGNHET